MKRAVKKQTSCPCPYDDCPRHGNCEKCQEYHHNREEKTGCGK